MLRKLKLETFAPHFTAEYIAADRKWRALWNEMIDLKNAHPNGPPRKQWEDLAAKCDAAFREMAATPSTRAA